MRDRSTSLGFPSKSENCYLTWKGAKSPPTQHVSTAIRLGPNAVLATFALGMAEQGRKLLTKTKHDYRVTTKMLLAATKPKAVKQDSPYGIQIGGKYPYEPDGGILGQKGGVGVGKEGMK